jgi:predicted nucleic acid-binding protein
VIILDASVLIAYLEGTDKHHARAEQLLSAEAADRFGASVLSMAEVKIMPARTGQLDRCRNSLRLLEVQTIPLESDDSERLAVLRASTGLKLPDCCVILAAEKNGASVATFDARLAHTSLERGLDVRGG